MRSPRIIEGIIGDARCGEDMSNTAAHHSGALTRHKLNCMLKWIQEASENQLRLIQTGIEYELSPQAVRRLKGRPPEPMPMMVNILCTRCGVVLPAHTALEHLDTEHPVHDCETGHEVIA